MHDFESVLTRDSQALHIPGILGQPMNIRNEYGLRDFERLVARETDRIERKSGIGQKPIQEALVALSNSEGGAIFVGVTDDGGVIGRRFDQGVEDAVHEAALAARDLGRYRVFPVDVEGTTVVAIAVDRRVEGFAQTSDGRILVRRGGRNVSMYGPELARFISERSFRRFELAEAGDLDWADGERELIGELCSAYGWSPRSKGLRQRLYERGLVSDDGRLTIAGALFLTDPATSLRQSKAMVEIRRYPAGETEYDRREEFGGPLHHQVSEATTFVVGELGSDLVVTGLYRHDLPRLPEVVVREAIANAVAHRSYETTGTAIVVEIRPDRVVVTSPGGLPEPVTVENLRQAQSARNQNVIDVLRRFKLAEDAGRGVDVMQDTMEEALLDPPRFEDMGHAVRVSLPLQGPITPRERAWVADLQQRGEIRGIDRLLLVHAARGERLTNSRAREILQLGRAETRDALQRLRDSGLLEQHGTRGGATYTLAEEVAPPAAFRLSQDELEAAVLKAAQEGPLTNTIIRELTGLSRSAALALARRLVREGRLRKVGERRGTRYFVRRERR